MVNVVLRLWPMTNTTWHLKWHFFGKKEKHWSAYSYNVLSNAMCISLREWVMFWTTALFFQIWKFASKLEIIQSHDVIHSEIRVSYYAYRLSYITVKYIVNASVPPFKSITWIRRTKPERTGMLYGQLQQTDVRKEHSWHCYENAFEIQQLALLSLHKDKGYGTEIFLKS